MCFPILEFQPFFWTAKVSASWFTKLVPIPTMFSLSFCSKAETYSLFAQKICIEIKTYMFFKCQFGPSVKFVFKSGKNDRTDLVQNAMHFVAAQHLSANPAATSGTIPHRNVNKSKT
jgi:hypothetical protein